MQIVGVVPGVIQIVGVVPGVMQIVGVVPSVIQIVGVVPWASFKLWVNVPGVMQIVGVVPGVMQIVGECGPEERAVEVCVCHLRGRDHYVSEDQIHKDRSQNIEHVEYTDLSQVRGHGKVHKLRLLWEFWERSRCMRINTHAPIPIESVVVLVQV